VGGAVSAVLRAQGHEVVRLVRRLPAAPPAEPAGGPDAVPWDPAAGRFEAGRLAGCAAVVHLAGENIAAGRWTARRKARIRSSRVDGTALLARGLAGLAAPPPVLVAASAVGYYGDRPGEKLTEESPPGRGFLAGVCRDWEAAAEPARAAGIRVVWLRIGAVLDPRGGLLARLAPVFRLGLGGPVGGGSQVVSWITLDDLLAVIGRALADPGLAGAVNAVAPAPVTNRELTAALAAALGRPALLPVPAWAARAAFGEMAEELLLWSARVLPERLLAAGFRFRDPELGPALCRLLAR
jgi:uncharacterized protein (TIGR01777 family)